MNTQDGVTVAPSSTSCARGKWILTNKPLPKDCECFF